MNILYSSDIIGYSGYNLFETIISNDTYGEKLINSIIYINSVLTLGSNIEFNYWNDPTLGSGNYGSFRYKTKKIPSEIIFTILDCSGLRSLSPVVSGSFDKYKNGVNYNLSDRGDCDLSYGGYSEIFNSSSYLNGYWLTGIKSKVEFSDYLGRSLLGNTNEVISYPYLSKYNSNGLFDLTFIIPFSCDSYYSDFDDPYFTISSCNVNIKLYNKEDKLITSSGYILDFSPPEFDGSIVSTNNLYKSIDDFSFSVNRNSITGHSRYTELNNVVKNLYSLNNQTLNKYKFGDYNNNYISNSEFIIPNSILERGDYCYVSYEPLLQGVKPSVTGNIAYTNLVTNCKGHKYWIDNVELRFGYNGSFSSNIIDELSRQNPYIYVNSVTNSGIVRVTLDINHEVWTSNTIRDLYSDNQIYPELKTLYIAAVQPSKFSFENTLKTYKISFNSYDGHETYPNVDYSNDLNIDLFTRNYNGYYTNNVNLGSSQTNIFSQIIDLVIPAPGLYSLYISVTDVFDQVSSWCILNKTINFNYDI